jgi:hypothetical protein
VALNRAEEPYFAIPASRVEAAFSLRRAGIATIENYGGEAPKKGVLVWYTFQVEKPDVIVRFINAPVLVFSDVDRAWRVSASLRVLKGPWCINELCVVCPGCKPLRVRNVLLILWSDTIAPDRRILTSALRKLGKPTSP